MMMHRRVVLAAIAALAYCSGSSAASAAVITGWNVHNGVAPTIGGSPQAPTFAPVDNNVLMAPFSPITLANDGDFVEVATTLTLSDRTANTGVNALNTQLRVGLFNGPAGPIAADDVANLGYIIEYSNVAAGGLIREQTNAGQTNPFTSPVNLGNGLQDSGADSIFGEDPGPVTFTLRLTRNSGLIDVTGAISGTDSGSGNPYLATYSDSGNSSVNFPANGAFTFNRIGLFLGGNVDATSALLENSTVTTNVPEPTAFMLAALATVGMLLRRQRQPQFSEMPVKTSRA